MAVVIALLVLIAAILLLGRGTVLAAILLTGLWGLSTASHAEVTYSFTNTPVAVICPDPGTTAYLESSLSPPHFSKEWKSIGGHSHCRTVKNDRPIIVLKTGSITFHNREYEMAELMPGGVVVSVDGFGGPYYVLATRIKKLPTADQMHANAAAFLPTVVQYSREPIAPSRPASAPAQASKPETEPAQKLNGADAL